MAKHKQLFYFLLLLFSISVAGWYYIHPRHKNQLSKAKLNNSPDAIITGVRVVKYGEDGLLSHRVYAPKMQHYANHNTSVFTRPVMVVYKRPQAPWTIKAKHAKAVDGDKRIDLSEHVVLHQTQSPHNIESTITTEALSYFPRSKEATTALPIQFKRPGMIVNSVGMKANIEQEHITLLSEARGRYEPQQTATH